MDVSFDRNLMGKPGNVTAMILLTRSTVIGILLTNLICFLTLCYCDTFGDDNTGDSDEDVKLKQALLLVELLKTDYVKVLRDNAELRNGNASEMSTCAATTAKDGASSAMATSNKTFDRPPAEPALQTRSQLLPPAPLAQWPPMPPQYGLTQQPLPQLRQFRRNLRNPYGFYRRMNPNDYYYYDNIPHAAKSVRRQFRRFNYVDPFGEHPNDTDGTTVHTSPLPTKLELKHSEQPTNKQSETTASSQTVSTGKITDSSSEHIQTTSSMSMVTEETTTGTSSMPKSTPHKDIGNPKKSSKTNDTSPMVTPRTITVSSSELDRNTTSKQSNLTAETTHLSSPEPKKLKLKHTNKPKKPYSTDSSETVAPRTTATNNKPRVIVSSPVTAKQKLQYSNFNEIEDNSPIIYNPKRTTSDPVMAQVASELFDEFKEETAMKKNEKLYTKTKGTKRSRNPFTYKTTMKIHLEGSTRYPIPLPENHAFCYTNPYNALCRTLI